MPFEFISLEIPEIKLIKPKIFRDERGYFFEAYKESEFKENGIQENFVQDNHSSSSLGVLRGLHYQLPPHAQGKLVGCIKGSIFDVAVDIRKNSPTFGKWIGVNLNSLNHYMLYIPAGFAHGFYTLQDKTEVLYKVTAEYSPEHDRGIIWNDPQLSIRWPGINVHLSVKDAQLPTLEKAEVFYDLADR